MAKTCAARGSALSANSSSDWNYALIYDFGGSSDGFAGTGSTGAAPGVGGASVGFLPGGAVSGVENAFLSYTGFKPFGGKLAIEGGIMDLPYTLDEATSSNDIPVHGARVVRHHRAKHRGRRFPLHAPARAGAMTGSGPAPM